MSGLLLDTHVLIWLAEKDARLGKKARDAIAKAHAGEALYVSAISFWEIGMLVARERLKLARPVDFWRNDVLKAGITEIPVSGDMGLFATQLSWSHRDPADRMIVASALLGHLHMVTADRMILEWKSGLKRIDAGL